MLEIIFTSLHNQAHLFGDGAVMIDQEFSGNLLAIDVTTKPEYVVNSQVIGYLYQVYQSVSKGYAIRSGKDLIRLELPQSESLLFIPTSFLTDSYTLRIDYTSVGITALVDGSNTVTIPELILNLPPIVSGLQGDVLGLNVDIEGLQSAIASLTTPSWGEVLDKPVSFPPSAHNHAIGEVMGLEGELAAINTNALNLTDRVEALETATPIATATQSSYKGIVENIATPLAFYWDDSRRLAGDFITKQDLGVVGTEPRRCLVDDSTGLRFLGASSGHYIINSHSGIEITGNITYLALFKTGTIPSPNTASLEGVLVKQTGSAGGIGISIGGSNALAEFTDNSGSTTTVVDSNTLASNTNYLVRAYRNGSNCGIQVNALTPTQVNTFAGSLIIQNTPLRLGNKVSTTFGFRGILKMAAIFNGHLEADEYAYLSGLDFNQFPL